MRNRVNGVDCPWLNEGSSKATGLNSMVREAMCLSDWQNVVGQLITDSNGTKKADKDMEPIIETEPLGLDNPSAAIPVVISGPCSAESEDQTMRVARELADGGVNIFRAGIWKPRTRPGSFEGMGVTALPWLRSVKEETGMKCAVEVATSYHAYEALKHGIDILWIGARTTANPFAVQEIATAIEGSDVTVLVKNPVNPDIDLWTGAMERLYRAGIKRLGAIHRGFSHNGRSPYRNMPLWDIPIEFRKRHPGMVMINDPSHIAGKRKLVAPVARKALSLGFDGIFVESHCDPDNALSDSGQQMTPADFFSMLDRLSEKGGNSGELSGSDDNMIDELRSEIDNIDGELLTALLERMEVAREIGVYKNSRSMPPLQPSRWSELLNSRLEKGSRLGLRKEFVEMLFSFIHKESVKLQSEVRSDRV